MSKPKYSRELHVAYLYGDGHLVKLFHEKRDGEEIGETAEVYEGFFKSHGWKGRMIISCVYDYDIEAYLSVIEGGRVMVSEASVEHGSDNTKRLNLAVGSIGVQPVSKKKKHSGGGWLRWTMLPGVLSQEMRYQPEHEIKQETFAEIAEKHSWGTARIVKLVRKPVEATATAA